MRSTDPYSCSKFSCQLKSTLYLHIYVYRHISRKFCKIWILIEIHFNLDFPGNGNLIKCTFKIFSELFLLPGQTGRPMGTKATAKGQGYCQGSRNGLKANQGSKGSCQPWLLMSAQICKYAILISIQFSKRGEEMREICWWKEARLVFLHIKSNSKVFIDKLKKWIYDATIH